MAYYQKNHSNGNIFCRRVNGLLPPGPTCLSPKPCLSGRALPGNVALLHCIDILDLGGEIVLSELVLENKDIDPKDLRDERILIKKAPPFLMDVEGASQTYVF